MFKHVLFFGYARYTYLTILKNPLPPYLLNNNSEAFGEVLGVIEARVYQPCAIGFYVATQDYMLEPTPRASTP